MKLNGVCLLQVIHIVFIIHAWIIIIIDCNNEALYSNSGVFLYGVIAAKSLSYEYP